MKTASENSHQIVDRFLKHLGEPVSEPQTERAVTHILDRLRSEGVRNPVRVLSTASPLRPARVPTWSAVTAAVVLLIAGPCCIRLCCSWEPRRQ
jgi:hypothetical protein